jgi:uroporphyrinogen decarboxylase
LAILIYYDINCIESKNVTKEVPNMKNIDIPKKRRFEADFAQLLKVLKKEPADRPVLFEFFMNPIVYKAFTESKIIERAPSESLYKRLEMMWAFYYAGYDYVTLLPPENFSFAQESETQAKTYSLNKQGLISDESSFESFNWPDPVKQNYEYLDFIGARLPDNMSMIVSGPGGLEENVIELTGYEQLCYMMIDNPDLVTALFNAVGSRLDNYYKITASHPKVGACISNDDWGFNTQTLLTREQMEKWVFPWHSKIAKTIHDAGKPAILHSCGNIYPIMDTIVQTIKYDGKHSYEDTILPVEDAWETYHREIAILGGIDLNYLIFESEESIYTRSKAMLERTSSTGGYALGSGNSIPDYIPLEKYIAMLSPAWE